MKWEAFTNRRTSFYLEMINVFINEKKNISSHKLCDEYNEIGTGLRDDYAVFKKSHISPRQKIESINHSARFIPSRVALRILSL